MRYFIRLGYRGEKFHGWQIQPHDCSVQQSIEEAMATLLRVPTPVTGAGRTDAGVNARLMVAHFDTTQPIKDIDRLMHGLNALLLDPGRNIRPGLADKVRHFDLRSKEQEISTDRQCQ